MAATPTLSIGTPAAPPHWALLERELLNGISEGCVEFFEHYFDPKTGYGLWTPRWGGNDGPDDGAENGLNWTLLHALGADGCVLELWSRGWEGHLRQYTEATTAECPLGRGGMYYHDFSASFDWFHHAEGWNAFTLSGLCTPTDPACIARTESYARMFSGEDPEAENYDKENKIIRSLFNGNASLLLSPPTRAHLIVRGRVRRQPWAGAAARDADRLGG